HRGSNYRQHLIDRASFPILVSGLLQRMLGGGLREVGGFCRPGWFWRGPAGTAGGGRVALGRGGAFAFIYFLEVRLWLALLSRPSDVEVFWPASGIAVGILIISGRRAYLPLVIGAVGRHDCWR